MQSTAIARSMEAFGDSPHYDAASKKLMSFKDVVAWILKLNTKEFADYDVSFIASNSILFSDKNLLNILLFDLVV